MTIVDFPLLAQSTSERGYSDRSMTPWLAVAGLAAAALVGTTGSMPFIRVEDLPLGSATGWFSSPWGPASDIVVPTIVDSVDVNQTDEGSSGTAATLKDVRERTGLTWDQIARLFGVSRRAVHLWAAGGRMTATNEETLVGLADVLSKTADGPEREARRAVLSLLSEARLSRGSSDSDINRPASTWDVQHGGLGSF